MNIATNKGPPISETSLGERARRLIESPAKFFNYNLADFFSGLSQQEIEELQFAALRYRFNALKDKVGMLQRLADGQGIRDLNELGDVIPLLFEHTIYKSYPPSLLENSRFDQINKFISRLTAHDLTTIDVSHCKSIDEWQMLMDEKTPLRIVHSSGTTGVLSFLPISDNENDISGDLFRMRCYRTTGPTPLDPDIIAIYPTFRSGGGAGFKGPEDGLKHLLGGDESRLFVAFPFRMSSDLMYLAARIRNAKANGTLDRLKIPQFLIKQQKAYETLQKDMPVLLTNFLTGIIEEHKGKRVIMSGVWHQFHKMATAGLEKGIERAFAPNSFVRLGGGAKGMVQPPNWDKDICRFVGIDKIEETYGMTEVRQVHDKCDNGHFHFSPVVIPFVLDPDTSKPLSREGVVTGRAAYFDLCAESRWGGFITGDEVTVNWDAAACGCGRSTPFIVGDISRLSERRGGDDKISCAASDNAHKEAMDFLTSFNQG